MFLSRMFGDQQPLRQVRQQDEQKEDEQRKMKESEGKVAELMWVSSSK